ncbi:right-handed parallel beta-helix repeat-containing protein [Pseudoalteromonas sp. MMG013]|uniref:right-handed parallel beta-helix repeat-containing protein n=1 Tax=Pseudoalteromonas sp. MMG013 TaxID=2822687 RepID=UPI001B368806|nr:right-handed parallel beta-helix repeat-containing protein [Pseudoalteromonas sp. MMG013]MBQ4862414.1 right-handed parallel beta-helix repeat-containing protein [Pseudoalteromonas sp. MMG013]
MQLKTRLNTKSSILCVVATLITQPVLATQVCDFVIPSSQYKIDGSQLQTSPGDRLCLAKGERGPLRVTNLHGSPEHNIVITNQDDTVTTIEYEYSIAIENSSYLQVTSTAQDSASPYKLKLGGTLSVGKLSHHIEIDHVEVYRARFAGLLIKTDPNCDSATWAENFTMSGLSIHNNFIHDTESGEGMYVGYTGHSRTLECDGKSTTVYPHKVTHVDISNNILENIAADGIQLNSVQNNARIAHNKIYRTGLSPFSPAWQNTGIQVGGEGVVVTGNMIFKSGGNGMMLDGDNLTIEHNTIIKAGENGIFARNPAQQDITRSNGLPHIYRYNHIIQSQSYGIKLYAINTATANAIYQNTIETDGSLDAAQRPMTLSYLNDSVLRTETDNRYFITP